MHVSIVFRNCLHRALQTHADEKNVAPTIAIMLVGQNSGHWQWGQGP